MMKMNFRFELFAALSALVLSLSCEHTVAPPTGVLALPDYSYITEPAARWSAYGLKNYTIEQKRLCFCRFPHEFVRLTVKDNKIVQGIDLANGQLVPTDILQYYQTVDSLFAWIEATRASNPERFEIEYDARFGYPRKIFYDYSSHLADEELWVETQALQQLSGNNGEPAVIIVDTPPASLQLDSFTLHGIAINGDKLALDISHGGGCKEHSYVLFMSPGVFLKSFPAQADLYLQHRANNDFCDALLRPQLSFNLRPVAESYEKLYHRRDPIQLNVYGYSRNQPGEKLSAMYEPQ